MSLPTLTPEQRAAALEKGLAVRRLRAELKKDLANGNTSLETAIESDQDFIKATRLVDLLKALPKIGPQKAAEIMAELGIAPNRRVGGLGARQKQALASRFGYETLA